MLHRVLKSAALSAAIASLFAATAAAAADGRLPVPQAVTPQVATTAFGGSFTTTFNITVKPGLPTTGYPMNCTVQLTPFDLSTGLISSESKTVLAARSGGTATCTVTIYYLWNLSSSSVMVNTNYTITAVGSGTSLIDRISTGALASVPVPANGASLTRTVDVVF